VSFVVLNIFGPGAIIPQRLVGAANFLRQAEYPKDLNRDRCDSQKLVSPNRRA
jgi:hypothetical protein